MVVHLHPHTIWAMKISLFDVFGGIIFCLVGITIIINPIHYSSQFSTYFDFKGYNVILGILFFLFGVGIIWTSIKNKKK